MPQTILTFGARPQLKPLLDTDLAPITNGNLGQFHERYTKLADSDGQDTRDFGPHSVFALTGQYTDTDETKHRMKIQPRDGPTQPFRLTQTSDVDSAIGFLYEGDEFPLTEGAFFYSIFNNTSYTLESSLHIPPHLVQKEDGTYAPIPYHMIPNGMMGHVPGACVPQILFRYMFPGLAAVRQPRDGSTVNIQLMRSFFTHAVRPAVLAVLPARCHGEWPIDFGDEQYRARRHNGEVVFTPRTILASHLTRFIDTLHRFAREVEEISWAKGFFIQVQIQGTKQSTRHVLEAPIYMPPNNLDGDEVEVGDEFELARGEAAAKAVNPLDLTMLDLDSWWVDVATTVHIADHGYSLLVDTSKHNWIITAMTGLDIQESSRRIEQGASKKYFCDETAHLGSASGFRMELDECPSGAAYIQVYTTEKSLVALKDNKFHAKHTEPQAVFKNWGHQCKTHFSPLKHVFESARDEEFVIDVRLESRVPLSNLLTTQRFFDPEMLANSLVKARTKPLWQWKIDRIESAMATMHTLDPLLPSVPPQKINGPATLVIALCYMTNALVNRPEPGQDFVQLADTCSVHEVVRNVLTAVRPLEAFFLHSLPTDSWPRISSHRVLNTGAIARLCGIKGSAPEAELRTLLIRSKPSGSAQTASEQPLPVWGEGPAPTSADGNQKRPFGIGNVSRAKRLKLTVAHDEPILDEHEADIPETDAGMAYASEDEDPELAATGLSNKNAIEGILQRMTGEMIEKIPDSGTAGSYRKVDRDQYSSVNFKSLCDSTQLPRLLNCWRQTNDPSQWTKVVEKIFPTASEYVRISTDKNGKAKSTVIQGLTQCSFFQDWLSLVSEPGRSDKDAAALVKFVRKKLDDRAQWLPLGKSDRLWSDQTGPKKAFIHGTDVNEKGGVVVVLNPRFCRDVNIPGGH